MPDAIEEVVAVLEDKTLKLKTIFPKVKEKLTLCVGLWHTEQGGPKSRR